MRRRGDPRRAGVNRLATPPRSGERGDFLPGAVRPVRRCERERASCAAPIPVNFTAGSAPLVANSPFMSWLYEIFTMNTFSALLGVVEITTAVLLAIKPLVPKLSVLGSVLAIGLFLATITFLITTPGVGEATAGGFPVLSSTGQFLVKDVALLGLSAWTVADSLRAVAQR
jgi:uncharacterized membrane protein YkgB